MHAVRALVFVLLVAACQAQPAAVTKAPAEPEAPGESAEPVASSEAEAPALVARPEAVEKPEPAIDEDPAELIGLDPAALEARLGRPALIRRESPAQVWQYEGETCVFDVFLYQEAAGYRVTYLEARDRTARPVEARGCLNALLRARREPGRG